MKNNRISISFIAKKVGVSKGVVSAVLSKKENRKIFVGKETKQKILQTAQKYYYIPSKSARELTSGKTNTIGIIFHKLTPFFSQLVSHLQQEALKNEFEITPYITNGSSELEEHYLNLCRDGRVDGIITVAHTDRSEQLYKKYTKKPYRLKILSIGPVIEGISTIHFDEKKVGQLAANHLIEIGCKSFCFFGGERISDRCNGFVEYLKNKGYTPVIFVGNKFIGYYNDGLNLAEKLFKLKQLPEGIFAYNDILGVILIKESIKHGIKVPEDIAIIGCDNTEICLYIEPELTSIDTNIKEIAKKSIEIIKKIIEEEKIEEYIKVPVKIIKRKSTERR